MRAEEEPIEVYANMCRFCKTPEDVLSGGSDVLVSYLKRGVH